MPSRNFEAKIKIKKLCIRYRNISDMPYSTEEERAELKQIESRIRGIYQSLTFASDIERSYFVKFIQNTFAGKDSEDLEKNQEHELDENNFHYKDLYPLNNHSKVILPTSAEMAKSQAIREDLNRLAYKKRELLMFKKRRQLKAEVDKLEKEIQQDLKEESYLTEKKDKDGITHLRNEQWQAQMDMAKLENDLAKSNLIELEERIEKMTLVSEYEENEIKACKDNLKRTSARINELKRIKLQIQMENFAVKVPKVIAKGSGYISAISNSLGQIGGELGKLDGRQGNDFGFNEKDMFDHNRLKNSKSKRRSKSKRGDWSYF